MADRVTNEQLMSMLMRLTSAAMRAGVDARDWTVDRGSRSNGVAARLNMGRGSAVRLGFTNNEAHDALNYMAEAFEIVATARENAAYNAFTRDRSDAPACDCGREPGDMHGLRCALLKWERGE